MRLNFSHGTHKQKAEIIDNMRKIVAKYDYQSVDLNDGSMETVCAIAADTKGPEVRTGTFSGDVSEIEVTQGQSVVLHTDPEMQHDDIIGTFDGTCHHVFVDYRMLQDEVGIGQRIFVDDGLLSMVRSASPLTVFVYV